MSPGLGEAMSVSRNARSKAAGGAAVFAAETVIARAQGEDWEALQELAAREPEDGFHRLWAGLAQAERGRDEAAVASFEAAIKLGCSHWRVHWYLAQAACRLGDVDRVDRSCSRVLRKNAEFWFARELPKHVRGYYSQKEQDRVIEQFFQRQPPAERFFVEVGAFDGRHYSNVRRLHEHYGWTGLSIEPVEKNFVKLEASYQGTGVKCVRAAVAADEGPVELNVSSYPHLPEWGSDVASLKEEGTKRWSKKFGAQWKKERVAAKRLTTILEENGVGGVGLLSIDAEGVDLEVLQTLDLSKFRPELIVIEYGSEREAIADYLLAQGYSILMDNRQDLFGALVSHGLEIGPEFKTINYTGRSGRPPFEEIQGDAESEIHQTLGLPAEAVETIVIVGGYLGREIDTFIATYPRAQVHVFEPSRRYFEPLAGRFSGEARVHCHNMAVGDADGIAPFHEGSLAGIGSLLPLKTAENLFTWIPRRAKPAERYEVEVVTLDRFEPLRGKLIDLLWCDVQGAELKVLEGARRTLRRCRALFLEVATTKTTYVGQCLLEDLQEWLSGAGFYLAGIGLCPSGNGTGNSLWLRYGDAPTAGEAGGEENPTTRLTEAGREALRGRLNPHMLKYIPLQKAVLTTELEPLQLVRPERVDIVAKYLYGRYRHLGLATGWAAELYRAHLYAFNKFSEGDGSGKEGEEAFFSAFHEVLDSVRSGGLSAEESYVPVGRRNVVLEGAHRVAAALVHGGVVPVAVFDWEGREYGFPFFAEKRLEEKWRDAMAIEFCRLKKDSFVATVFPVAQGKDEEVRGIIGRRGGEVFYQKEIYLNRLGAVNLTRQIYAEEPWVGTGKNGFSGARRKAGNCFARPGPLRLYAFVLADGLRGARAIKEEIRELFGLRNHSVHINDGHPEAVATMRTLLNANSVHFLNHAVVVDHPRFAEHFRLYRDWIREGEWDADTFCVDGSSTMAAYGIREARDLDFLHHGEAGVRTEIRGVDCHNAEAHHHVTGIDDILYNPDCHFYYYGLKFVSLGILRAMKAKRGEAKDREDVGLIDALPEPAGAGPAGLRGRLVKLGRSASTRWRRRVCGRPGRPDFELEDEVALRGELLRWYRGGGVINVLEVGAGDGSVTRLLQEVLMAEPGSRLTCVEDWGGGGREAFEGSVDAGGTRVVEAPAGEAPARLGGERFDLVFYNWPGCGKSRAEDWGQYTSMLIEGGMFIWGRRCLEADGKGRGGIEEACRELGLRPVVFGRFLRCIR